MIDIDQFADDLGIDLPGANPKPARTSPSLSAVGERHRDELLGHVERARSALQILEAALRDAPNDDVTVDAIDRAFAEHLRGARAAGFRRASPGRACRVRAFSAAARV